MAFLYRLNNTPFVNLYRERPQNFEIDYFEGSIDEENCVNEDVEEDQTHKQESNIASNQWIHLLICVSKQYTQYNEHSQLIGNINL
ncbi:hypothetical protein FGO68_gene14211 [Halteria grandinella]|uniref:Uncharacterized protein n=1 Tax=Halteria grandinella TaxID=5974 RepID=A0A8J8T993_HALGN|nr:hypothetical protein FGO68_gene14211 [Halteria grandinella]